VRTPTDLLLLRQRGRGNLPQWGCIVLVLLPLLVFGVVSLVQGAVGLGLGLAALALLLMLATALTQRPYGCTVSAGGVMLEQRSLLTRKVHEIPRDSIVDLWLDVHPSQAGLHVRCRGTSKGPTWYYAVPLHQDSWDEEKDAAKEVARLLKLPWRLAVLVPAPLSFQRVKRLLRGVFRGDKVRAAMSISRDPLLVQSQMTAYQGSEHPEVWLLDPEQAKLTHQKASGEGKDEEYSLAEVADLEVEVKTSGEERGSDEDRDYLYVCQLFLVLESGERFLLKEFKSVESRKTALSTARKDAEWTSCLLRKYLLR
jgi:hypothetical protein